MNDRARQGYHRVRGKDRGIFARGAGSPGGLPVGRAGRNDADDFDGLAIVGFLPDGMGNQQKQIALCHAQGLQASSQLRFTLADIVASSWKR